MSSLVTPTVFKLVSLRDLAQYTTGKRYDPKACLKTFITTGIIKTSHPCPENNCDGILYLTKNNNDNNDNLYNNIIKIKNKIT